MGDLTLKEIKTFLHIQALSIVITGFMLAKHIAGYENTTNDLIFISFDYLVMTLLAATMVAHCFVSRSQRRKLCERAVIGYIFLTISLLLYLLLFH